MYPAEGQPQYAAVPPICSPVCNEIWPKASPGQSISTGLLLFEEKKFSCKLKKPPHLPVQGALSVRILEFQKG
ncbi:hypothetical protein CLOM621_08612 [Clostridium sp. M62/1]|nr:hypothetical protein CLOM621_08612 [Clostridium sp. M62/1]